MGVPQNGWFIMENLIKMDDLGVHLFQETPISQTNQKPVLSLMALKICIRSGLQAGDVISADVELMLYPKSQSVSD